MSLGRLTPCSLLQQDPVQGGFLAQPWVFPGGKWEEEEEGEEGVRAGVEAFHYGCSTDVRRVPPGRKGVRTKVGWLALAGLVQRCVIIQKDEHGFGFTVSGDRIVLVQSVRPGEERLWVGGLLLPHCPD